MNGTSNPFRGPRPYRTRDKDRFFGRDDYTRKLSHRILAWPCVTVFGPSGAGKSSLLQAGVLPYLVEKHGFRVVRVDSWLTQHDPVDWLVRALFTDLELGPVPAELSPREAVDRAMQLAERRSNRPLLLCVDQLEQLFLPGRSLEQTQALLGVLGRLARTPCRGLQMVLLLREDYLGRVQDRSRAWWELLEHTFRLAPLTVREMAAIACKLAASGDPPQQWDEEELRALMVQVRVAGLDATPEAEVQTAFAQIVCRVLWEERAAGKVAAGLVEAEPIVRRYLDATLKELGPLEPSARRLLEDHLVASDGSRTLLTEQQARNALPAEEASHVLDVLEGSAVLRAEEHGGSRYFELGHDWLAKRVFELRQARRRREESVRRRKERRGRMWRRSLVVLSLVAVAVAALYVYVLKGREDRMWVASVLGSARELLDDGESGTAALLLRELHGHDQHDRIEEPAQRHTWSVLTYRALGAGIPEVSLWSRGVGPDAGARFSRDNQRVLVAGGRGLRIARVDGKGTRTRLEESGAGAQLAIGLGSDGQRVVAIDESGTARVWWLDKASDESVPVGSTYASGLPAVAAALSPDLQRAVTLGPGGEVWVWRVDGAGTPLRLRQAARGTGGLAPGTAVGGSGREGAETAPRPWVGFSPDGQRVLGVDAEGTARVWRADRPEEQVLARHVRTAAFSPDGGRVLTVGADDRARLLALPDSSPPDREPRVREVPGTDVLSPAFSSDGRWVVTAGASAVAKVWRVDGPGNPTLVAELRGHQGPVRSAALSPDGRRVATTGEDGTVRVWPSNGQGEPRVFAAHRKPGRLVRFSSDGEHVVSSGEDGRTHVWRVEEPLPRTVLARAPSGTARFAAFSRDGVWALTLGQDGTPWIQHTDGQGQPVALPGRLTRLRSAVFDGDGQRLLTVGEDGQVLVWRTDGTRAPEPLPATEGGPLLSAVFSPEGPGVIGISQDGRVWRWPEGTGGPEALKGLQQHGPLGFAALSPDGQHVVAVDKDQRVRVLRPDGTTDDPTKHGLTEKVEAPPPFVVFSPDGKSVLVPYARGMARVWPLSGARDRSITYLRHEGRLVAAAFGTDGRRVLTVDEEGTVSVWRMEANGRRRGAPVVLRAPGALAATLDEAREDVLIRRKDGSLERWTLSSDRLVSLLEERVYGCLRPDDRMAYLAEKDSTARSKNDECKKVPGSTPRN